MDFVGRASLSARTCAVSFLARSDVATLLESGQRSIQVRGSPERCPKGLVRVPLREHLCSGTLEPSEYPLCTFRLRVGTHLRKGCLSMGNEIEANAQRVAHRLGRYSLIGSGSDFSQVQQADDPSDCAGEFPCPVRDCG